MKKGYKFLMRVRGNVGQYILMEADDGTAKSLKLECPDGEPRKFIGTIVRAAWKNQEKLKAELDADNELDDILDEEVIVDDNPPEEPVKRPKKQKTEAPAKEEKKMYWEKEAPLKSILENNELRFYEEAGKLQMFSKYEADGGKKLGRGITLDTANMSNKDALKALSMMTYALKSSFKSQDVKVLVDELEKYNMMTNPEDYMFDSKELDAMDEYMLYAICESYKLKPSKVSVKKDKNESARRKSKFIAMIMEAQNGKKGA